MNKLITCHISFWKYFSLRLQYILKAIIYHCDESKKKKKRLKNWSILKDIKATRLNATYTTMWHENATGKKTPNYKDIGTIGKTWINSSVGFYLCLITTNLYQH